MKAIIIEEERFAEIIEALQYDAEQMISTMPENKDTIAKAHRRFNFLLVRWMQSHGASCTR